MYALADNQTHDPDPDLQIHEGYFAAPNPWEIHPSRPRVGPGEAKLPVSPTRREAYQIPDDLHHLWPRILAHQPISSSDHGVPSRPLQASQEQETSIPGTGSSTSYTAACLP